MLTPAISAHILISAGAASSFCCTRVFAQIKVTRLSMYNVAASERLNFWGQKCHQDHHQVCALKRLSESGLRCMLTQTEERSLLEAWMIWNASKSEQQVKDAQRAQSATADTLEPKMHTKDKRYMKASFEASVSLLNECTAHIYYSSTATLGPIVA